MKKWKQRLVSIVVFIFVVTAVLYVLNLWSDIQFHREYDPGEFKMKLNSQDIRSSFCCESCLVINATGKVPVYNGGCPHTYEIRDGDRELCFADDDELLNIKNGSDIVVYWRWQPSVDGFRINYVKVK